MNVHYYVPEDSYLEPPEIEIGGSTFIVGPLSVFGFMKLATAHNKLTNGEMSEEDKAIFDIKTFIAGITDDIIKKLPLQKIHMLAVLCRRTIDVSKRYDLNLDGKTLSFSKSTEEVEKDTIYIDLMHQVALVARFYGFTHKDIMDMPYVMFIAYLRYMPPIEATESKLSLVINRAAQATNPASLINSLDRSCELPGKRAEEFSNKVSDKRLNQFLRERNYKAEE